MKKQLFSLALLLSLGTSFAGSSFAASTAVVGQEQRQDREHDKDKDHKRGQRGAQNKQRHLDQLAKDLDLSSKDKGKVEKIFQEQQQQMQALRSRSGADRSQAMAERKRIQESTNKKLKDVLSKKQYAQYEAKRQERQRQMADRQNDRRGNDQRNNFRRDSSRRS
ncbi:hypothetical protein MTX78_17625 [Hymenobacter tibetensis]|uniref:DUF4890 domain-containing protein n=1 Tax=Hymenobacter tibetensis TaxID=497967 RepID=A0ABY4CWQ6_9BACT|nr:hypothetical protein [Hymenobacter tibetensis]UOG73929.1 hypothetical protein MTX78_17625 [Hymenobacter tibetensis]